MAISDAELKRYKATTITDTTANGGKMSAVESVSGVKNNIFPDVSEAERTAGVTRYRKMFGKVANDADLTLSSPKLHFTQVTPADDYVVLFAATQTDTQNDITGSERLYGAGTLKTNVSAGGTSFVVTLEADVIVFVNADMVWIGDGVNSEYHDNVTISKSSLDITITLDSGDQLANDYTTTATIGASVYEPSDVEGSIASWSETSGSGTFDESGHPVVVDNIGGIEESWTLTFTSSTAFGVSGATVGSVGTGTISGDFEPSNSDFTKPYFKLPSAGWGGTWANAETLTFTTHPASAPYWMKEVVSAGAASYADNDFYVLFGGASA